MYRTTKSPMLQCETISLVSLTALGPEGCRIVFLIKIIIKKGVLKQDDDRRPFVKDTIDPALSVTFVMLRDKVC